nr:histidine kinase [Knoellia sp. DB2414S]
MDSLRRELEPRAAESDGLLPLVTSYVLLTAITNVIYFGGAIIGGQVSWRAARQGARLGEQARTIADQAEELQRQAVLAERLRIARELHDVVAHHVSVIGIQAGASRRVLTTDPPAATAALSQVEASSREAVAQMRSLVGALRDPADGVSDGRERRAPEPGLADLATLVGEAETAGLTTAYEAVEATPGALEELPGPLGLAIYRIVQEALTNVRKHSTANHVGVVVRVDPSGDKPFAEVEVVDNGRPRPGTSGSGLGLLGVRERAAARRGLVEVGPRVGGGYRVRVRFPLEEREGAR